MKILVLSSHTPSLFWFRVDMVKAFIEQGCEVVAVGDEPESKWTEKFSQINVKYRQAFIQRNGTNPLKDLKTLKSLKRIIKEESPDKIFTYQAKTVIYGCLAAKKKDVEIFALVAGMGSVFLSKTIKGKVLGSILKFEYKIALRRAKKVFFQNQDDIQFFVDNHIVKEEKVVKINGSGVNLEKFVPQAMPKEPAFLCISRIIRDKGVIEYLEAAKIVKEKYPNVRFLLVGPYDSNPSALKEEDLKPYVEDNVVEYFGEQSNVSPYLEQCSVYVLPSYREGTPKTVLEAMASFKAIITTDAPGCKETVEDGVNGFLVPVKDVKALAMKMVELIEKPDVVLKMAQNGRSIVEEKFDVKKVNKQIIDIMEL